MALIFAGFAQAANVRVLRPVIDRAAAANQLNPMVLEAIMRHESSNGKSNASRKYNNYAGIMYKGKLRRFSTAEECVAYTARLLARYSQNGRKSIEQIGRRYAPYNPKWASKVRAHLRAVEYERNQELLARRK